jgi:peptidoglycan/xylan/chitin deacetylase (PgdA/CDA1 family)/ketosteroid isomerase-like protein
LGGSSLLILLGASLAFSAGAFAAPRPIAVTVDDLPIALGSLHRDPSERKRITLGLLATLARHDIQAVGLVTWRNVIDENDIALLEMWLDAGHELGNHSYSHNDYTRTASEEFIADVERGREQVARLLEARDKQLRFFRFPMLHEGETPEKLEAMRGYLMSSGQRNLPVTIDNADASFARPWVEAGAAGDEAARIAIGEEFQASLRLAVRHHERTSDRLFDGAVPQILLLHANEIGTVEWDPLFTWLVASGHRFAAIDDVLTHPAFDIDPAFVSPKGYSLWDRIASQRETEQARTAVADLLGLQAAAWSRGDLDTFCSVYADDAVFVSTTGLTRGRQEILDRYRQRYPDRGAMGALALEVLEFDPARGVEISMLGDSRPGSIHGASVVARWTLSYPDRDDAMGLTLLAMRRVDGRWIIVHDASM